MTAAMRLDAADAIRYGLLGLPLAFVALPLYIVLPNYYARHFDVSLAALGAVLLGARLVDGLTDPLIGRWVDRLFVRSTRAVLNFGAGAAVLLALGFVLLFFPPVRGGGWLLAWVTGALAITYAAFSGLSIAHQSWGAMLGGNEAQRSLIVSWREGCGLIGVLLASLLATGAGLGITSACLAVALAVGLASWASSKPPQPVAGGSTAGKLWLPFARPDFRRLLAVFVFNGIASAIPATLVLFFVQDRLQAPAASQPLVLACYFLCAALSLPLWQRGVRRFGLARTWLAGMVLAIAVFAWAWHLGAGDTAAFLVVCAMSGAALGADLALPGALLAGVIARAGDSGQREGAYFGWWNFAIKLNLALAAGLALPLLGLAGYTPGTRDEGALTALAFAYCVLPCMLKLIAAGLLYFTLIRQRNTL